MPDVVALLDESNGGEEVLEQADLVVEVVSGSASDRDYESSRVEYQQAGIPEYCIVDPAKGRVIELALKDGAYVEHSRAANGAKAKSALLKGFSVDVKSLFER